MAKRTKYTNQLKAAAVADLDRGMTANEVAAKHGLDFPKSIYVWRKALKGKSAASSAKRSATRAANGSNGHAELAPVPDTDAQLSIRGLTPFLRKELDAKLRGVVREELAAMFGGLKQ